MNIKIGTASKEINSTKRPTGLTTIAVEIKEPSSITAPVLRIQDGVWDPAYNYCYIAKWSRYYFLHDAVITPGGIWEVQCAVDVLASWKTYIQSATAYVRRSASDYSLFIPDSTWTHTSTPTVSHKALDTFTTPFDSSGCFALFTASSKTPASTDAVPAMSVYLLDAENMGNLVQYMFSTDFYEAVTSGVDTTSAALAQTFFNPFQYIIKCMWLPFPTSFIWGAASAISFGWWTCDTDIATGKKVAFHSYDIEFEFTYGSYTSWTDRASEWSSYMLYFPGFGEIPLNPTYAGRTIEGHIYFDFATGNASMFLFSSDGDLIQTARGRLAADVQLSSLYEDLVQDVSSISGLIKTGIGVAGGIGATISEKSREGMSRFGALGPLGAAAGLVSGIVELGSGGGLAEKLVNGVQAGLQPSVTTIGTAGDRTTLESQLTPIITSVKYSRLCDDHETLGGMCCETMSLSGLSGYTEIVNPEINAPATSSEISAINSFLSGGFYLE